MAKTIESFIEALNIAAKYAKAGLQEKYLLNAEHDVIYLSVSSETLTEESADGARLSELGWHCDSSTDSWAYFT